MILEVFSNLNDSIILWFHDSVIHVFLLTLVRLLLVLSSLSLGGSPALQGIRWQQGLISPVDGIYTIMEMMIPSPPSGHWWRCPSGIPLLTSFQAEWDSLTTTFGAWSFKQTFAHVNILHPIRHIKIQHVSGTWIQLLEAAAGILSLPLAVKGLIAVTVHTLVPCGVPITFL